MAIIDSTAAFKARAKSFGITDADLNLLAAHDMISFAAYAFLVPYNVNSPDDALLKRALTDLLGAEPNTGNMAKFRRLQFESHTQMLSDTKARLERTDESAARKMPAPERAARHRDQIRRLVSIQITQDNEPSHALLDLAQQMVEDAQVRHISVDKCTSRVHELQGLKVVEGVAKDPSGVIRVVSKSEGPTADLTSDYRIRQAFLRRSLALDQASLVSFDVHERWVNSLFAAMARAPPAGYSYITLEQVLSADRELFVYLGEECRDGVGLDSAGNRLVEEAMKLLMVDIRITFLLTPLRSGSSPNPAKRALSDSAPPLSKNQAKKQRRQVAIAKHSQPYLAVPTKGKGKGKGKGKVTMPAGLEGCWSRVDGELVCMAFQLGNCSENVAAGSKCSKGMHKCCTPQCKGLHGHFECPSKRN